MATEKTCCLDAFWHKQGCKHYHAPTNMTEELEFQFQLGRSQGRSEMLLEEIEKDNARFGKIRQMEINGRSNTNTRV